MNLDADAIALLSEALESLREGFSELPPAERPSIDTFRPVLLETAERLRDNYPYQHPLYVGQMLKPPHPLAQLAYTLAMCLNPNNHAREGGRASTEMENQAVAQIAGMVGWGDRFLGHLCSGGTIGNFEALWVSRELTEGKILAASSQAHYTHSRVAAVLGLPFRSVAVNASGQMDVADLRRLLDGEPVGTVVVTMGTTALGAIDPLDEVLRLRERYGFRIHLDAAYGGYFKLAGSLRSETRRRFDLMSEADSIVIDPHKHGLQPYGCGCVLFRDPGVAAVYKHESPYTYFTEETHLGEISLECSRAGAAAVALWTTMRRFPLVRGGEFADGLDQGREAALELDRWLRQQEAFVPIVEPELDIVVWAVGAERPSGSSRRARRVFEEAAARDLHLALLSLPRELAEPAVAFGEWDEPSLTCLRACVIKPEHRHWMPELLARLDAAAREVLQTP